MEKNKNAVPDAGPEKLLSVFTGGKMVVWGTLAIVVHVIFVGATSIGYIKDTWIDPEGAKLRKAAMEQKAAAEAAAAEQKAAAEAAAKLPPPTEGKPATVSTQETEKAQADDQKVLESRKDTPTGKRLTDVASSNEIPKEAKDLGLSIEDTNPRR